jgi:MSHA biogenesis protein MshQ
MKALLPDTRALRWLLVLLQLAALWMLPDRSAAVTVVRTPVAADCTSAASGGTKVWNNPSRASANDNSVTTASVDGTTTRYLQCLNYGFTIPATAVINGITVTVSRRSSRTSDGGSRDALMRVVKGGVIGTVDRATATVYTTSEVAEAHGGSTDLWGEGWTAADINSASFGAAFAATKPSSKGKSHSISVDLISITVDYTPDTTPPTASTITRASLNPAAGATVSWTVTFSESVTGVDTGDFQLAATGVTGAAISSVTGSGTTWTVTASTGTGSGTLGLNLNDNDSIVDLAANRLGGTGSGNGNRVGEVYTIDKLNPNAVSIARAAASPTNAASLAWTVTFNKSVTGVDSTDFALAATGTAAGAITSVTGSGLSRTVTATGVTGSGTLGLNLVDNDSIIDGTSIPLGGAGAGNGNRTGEVYAVDRTGPAVLSITRDQADPTALDTLSWTVTLSESVSGLTAADFALATSGPAGASISSITGSGSTWTVTADPGYGAGTIGLNIVDDDSVIDALGNPLGGTGAGNGNFTGQVYTVTTPPFAAWLFEESSWNGSADQVLDAEGGNDGTALNAATTAGLTPALAGASGTCRYGTFTSASSPVISKGYVDLSDAYPYLAESFTFTGWVRTTANSTGSQWIFSHNTTGTGYALSLGTAGAGRLRFQSGGAATPNLDSPSGATSLLANDTWYFVAAVADFSGAPNIVRRLYVFNAAGSLLPGYPVSVASTGWGDTEDGAATIGGDGTNSFRGNLDDIRVFGRPLNQAAITAVAQARHACSTAMPDHYEVSVAAASLSCLPTTVTVTACADASSPCTNPYTAAVSATAALAASAGALGSTTLVFDAAGVATTTLSHPGAADGAAVSLTLSNESIAATNARQCCPGGASCTAANSCGTTFSTAGLIYSTSPNGAQTATFPAQVAGVSSGTYYLRAVRTGTTTQACEAALTGPATVQWGNVCVNPALCSSGNLMSVTGSGSATAIANNPSGAATSFTNVAMTFDGNGAAPFSFTYQDAGRIRLDSKLNAANGATLSGILNTSSHVTRPARFALSGIRQTASPALVNPGAVDANGARFVKAGESFSVTVTAQTQAGAATPNFGKESTPEDVVLTPVPAANGGASTGSLANGTIAGGSFVNGVATATNLAYSEVGIVTLSAALSDGSYINTGGSVTGTSGNVGRFVPARFAVTGGSVTHRVALGCAPASAFSHLGENFRLGLTLTAQNLSGGTTQNYTGSFAKFDPAQAGGWNLTGIDGATAFSTAVGRLSLGTASGSWSNGVAAGVALTAQAGRAASPDGPFNAAFGVAPVDSDGVAVGAFDMASASGGGNDRARIASVPLYFGRLRIDSAIGAADRGLALPVTVQSWNGSAFATQTLDSCTTVPAVAVNFGNLRRTLTTADTAVTAPVAISAGRGTLRLAAPGGGRSGTVDVTLSLGSGAVDASCLQPWTPGTGDAATAGANLTYLRTAWCGSNHDKDPAARASFGMPRGADTWVYRRENH